MAYNYQNRLFPTQHLKNKHKTKIYCIWNCCETFWIHHSDSICPV